MLIKMGRKFKPKTYNKTLLKIKKLSGISKKVDLKTPMLESFFNSGIICYSIPHLILSRAGEIESHNM